MRATRALYFPPPLRSCKCLKICVLQRRSPVCLGDGLGHMSWPRRAGVAYPRRCLMQHATMRDAQRREASQALPAPVSALSGTAAVQQRVLAAGSARQAYG